MRIRTGFSFKNAYGHLEDVASRLKEIGWKHQPISDRMSTYSFAEWAKQPTPIFGVELAVVPALGAKKPAIDYCAFFAQSDLRDLNEIIGTATSNVGREPSLTYEQAAKNESLVKVHGERCVIDKLDPTDPSTYVGLSPAISKGLYTLAKAKGMMFIATSDNFYPRPEDKELYRIAMGRNSTTQTYLQHILSDEEWIKALEYIASDEDRAKALQHRQTVMETCSAKMRKAELLHPVKEKTLRQMCLDGAATLSCDLSRPGYQARMDRELDMIAKKDFEDYFYIIADMVQWARKRMIVGPARGSSCGSLVCYLLQITTIDPIPFGLIFERFIDVTRVDLPDIDIDFSDARRHLVFEYAEEKYGKDHVARLGTVGTFGPRSIMLQAGKSLRIPKWQTDKVMDGLIERSSGDARASSTLEDTLKETEAGRKLLADFPEVLVTAKLEGHPNNASQHAAGIVITQNPVTEYVAVNNRTYSTMCDKYDAEKLGLLKIDALGLTQLSVFERTIELIAKPIILEQLPLDDITAFDVLNKHHYAGVFQFNGLALQSLAKQVQVNSLEDIVALTALARPGPLATGGANEWLKRRNGAAVEMAHPLLEPQLGQTFGIVVYQEQVLEIGRQIGDLSWEEVTELRKAMSKSLGVEYFDRFGDKWKLGAVSRGIAKSTADAIWTSLCSMGSWAFNRSHAVAYGMVSYWCCWLKAHYPVQFAAATLDAESNPIRQIAILRELRDEGISYIAIDPDHSTDKWAVKDPTTIVGPLTAVKGIGPATVDEILTARKKGEALRPALAKRLAEAKTDIATLFPVADAIKRLHPDPDTMNIITPIRNVKDIQCGYIGEVVALVVASKIVPRDMNETVLIAKRKGQVITGPTAYLNMFVRDDTDEIFASVPRFKFEQLGRNVSETGRANKSLYAIRGTVPPNFRMISITGIRYLGEIDQV